MTVVAGRQILGTRERQEDAFRIAQQDPDDPGADLLILLADGMGGHVGGDVASGLVLETFEQQFIRDSRLPKPVPRLVEAMEVANVALRDRIAREPALAGMGSTLVAACKIGNRLHWLSVGDSLLYLLRGGALRRLNADHSVYGELNELVHKGQMTRQEADNHPRRNVLRSAMTGDAIALVDTGGIVLLPADVLLLASDGLDTLDETRIAQILSQSERGGPRGLGADLLNDVEAAARPKQDNTTVVVYRFDPAGERTTRDSLIVVPEEPRGVSLWSIAAVVALVAAAAGIVSAVGWRSGGEAASPANPEAITAEPHTQAPIGDPGAAQGTPPRADPPAEPDVSPAPEAPAPAGKAVP